MVALIQVLRSLATAVLARHAAARTHLPTNSNLFQITDSPSGWSFRSPHSNGKPWLYKAVSLVDTTQFGSNGDYIQYDAVLLQHQQQQQQPRDQPDPEPPYVNVTMAAADAYRRDVVGGAGGAEDYSMKEVGDTLYFGGVAAIPLTSYVWLDQLGVGGEIQWPVTSRPPTIRFGVCSLEYNGGAYPPTTTPSLHTPDSQAKKQ